MPVITVSRCSGLYTENLLENFAKKHNYAILSHEIIEEVAKKIDKPIEEIKNLYGMENFSSFSLFLSETLKNIRDASSIVLTGSQIDSPEFYPLYYPNVNKNVGKKSGSGIYFETLQKVILDVYERDNVIIIGRGAQVVLKDKPNVIHLRFEGDFEKSVDRVVKNDGLDKNKAECQIKKIDKNRAEYLSHFYDEDINNPSLYHLIVNVDKVGISNLCSLLNKALEWIE